VIPRWIALALRLLWEPVRPAPASMTDARRRASDGIENGVVMNKILCLPMLAAGLFAVGCVGEAPDAEGPVGETSEAMWSVSGSATTPTPWDSGKTSNLSAWQSVTCNSTYGSSYLLNGLTAFKEPTSNLDNFIARLDAKCTEYATNVPTDTYLPTGTSHTDNVFEGLFRSGASSIEATGTEYPVGVTIFINAVDGYVKNLQIETASKSGHQITANNGTTGWVLDYIHWDDSVGLICPDQNVMTGIGVRYDTTKGKIRQMKVFCRPLTWSFG
jgi:hypothetical protein